MTQYVEAHKEAYGVEPIAPSTYYAAVARTPSRRRLRDAHLKAEIERVHADNFGVCGIEKVWRHLSREGIEAGRERVARLMREREVVQAGVGVGRRPDHESPPRHSAAVHA